MRTPRLLTLSLCALACQFELGCHVDTSGDDRLALALGQALATHCPQGDGAWDEAARDHCADALGDLPLLRTTMREPFLWGGQSHGYSLERGMNKFNPRVWRRLYLSTFMFSQDVTIEHVDDATVLHVPVRFRGAMPPGAYPYPFWHSPTKWTSYNYTTTIHFVVRNGGIEGALRASAQDTSRELVLRGWDGRWRWSGGNEPHVSLYAYLFPRANPYVTELDTSYRTLESALRKQRCTTCHAPDNRGGSKQLEFFVYPAQALAGRHDIVAQLEDDLMPPENTLGIAPGVPEGDRQHLLVLARDFERVGDAALAWADVAN